MGPALSVVIPFYRAYFVSMRLCVVSFSETCPPPEIIIVDYGSAQANARELERYELSALR